MATVKQQEMFEEGAIPAEPDAAVSSAAAAMGRKGGPARARALSPERRSEIAKRAALARWTKGDQA